jgi:hypothetical protein
MHKLPEVLDLEDKALLEKTDLEGLREFTVHQLLVVVYLVVKVIL